MVSPQRLYQSPPNSGGNDGAIPAVYDPAWQTYTNVTQAQIAAFQSFPQDLVAYASVRRWLAEISGTSVVYGGATIPLATDDRSKLLVGSMRQAMDDGLITTIQFVDTNGNSHTLDLNGIKAVYGAVVGFVAQLFAAQAALNTAINAKSPTVTLRSQIDALYAPLAPNSPSTVNPSPR